MREPQSYKELQRVRTAPGPPPYSWTTVGQAKDKSSSPNPLVKVLRRGRHCVWGPNSRRATKEWNIAIISGWVDK